METVSATNEALTLFSTLREICRSVTRRIDNFRGNREQIEVLKDELSITEQKANVCRSTLEEYSNAIVTESLKFEVIDLKGMVQTIRRVEEKVVELEKKPPSRRRLLEMFIRANRDAEEISKQVKILREISSGLKEMNEKLKGIAKENDVFQPDFSTIPKLRTPVHLDFSTEITMEGKLKASVLKSVGYTPPTTENVYGQVTAVVGIAGMGGIGKTTAILGLAQDPEIRETFSSGGIYLLVVGKDASPAKVVGGLKNIVRYSGGKRWSEKIDKNGSVESAVRTTSCWFSRRKALFILDDLWQTSSNQLGYYNALVGLLDNSPKSHILISTRSDTIACEASERVEFEPRESTGPEARGMFRVSAGLGEMVVPDNEFEKLVEQILMLCGGIPLMLSIAGAQVRARGGTPIASLRRLLHSLGIESLVLPKEKRGRYPYYFNQTVEESLKVIADVLETSEKFMDAWNEHSKMNPISSGVAIVDFVIECFQRLCVLPWGVRVPGEVFFGIWCSINKTIAWSVIDSLVDFHLLLEFVDAEGKSTFGLHDVILGFCENASRSGENAKYESYHREFLSNSWELCNLEPLRMSDTTNVETREHYNRALREFWLSEACEKSRPWWKIFSSRENLWIAGELQLSKLEWYLLDNLVRHLKESGRLAEAVGLLSHMGWTKVRAAYGSIIALDLDFSLIDNALRLQLGKEGDHKACDDALHGLTNIWNVVRRAWSIILSNVEALPTHSYGYLLDNENELPLVERYLQSAADIATGPWLKPKSAFWYILDSSSNPEAFRTAEKIIGAALVKDTQFILAATLSTLFWIYTETMIAARERVIRNKEGSLSEISAFYLCKPQGTLLLGFSTGELELRSQQNGDVLLQIPNAHEEWVWSVSMNADGHKVVSGSNDGTVRLWDSQSGAAIGEPLCGHEDCVFGVAVSADGRTVVSGSKDKTVRLWDAERGAAIGEPLRGHEDIVWGVAMSENGRRVVSASFDKTIRLWDAQNGVPIGEPLRGHEDWVVCVAMEADGRTIVSGAKDKTVRLWDAESGTPIGEPLRGHGDVVWSVSMSEEARKVLSVSYDKTIRLWNMESAAAINEELSEHDDMVSSVALSKDGRMVVSGSADGTVRLWDVESGAAIGEPFCGHEDAVLSVAISSDGQKVVSGSEDKTIRLWDVENGTPIGEPLCGHEDVVFSVAMSQDGMTLVSGSADMTVRLWDVESGIAVGEPLRGHEDVVRSVAISADGRTVVSGSTDMTIRLWDAKNGSAIGEPLLGHENMVRSVAMSSDGRIVVSGSADRTVRMWNAENGVAIGEPFREHEECVSNVVISADGRLVVSRSLLGTVMLWSRSASESHWNRSCICSVPVSSGWPIVAFIDGHQSSGGTGRLACPFFGGVLVFELIQP